MVPSPLDIENAPNKTKKLIAVTISGFTIGILFKLSVQFLSHFLFFDNIIAPSVPMIVDTVVEITATKIVVIIALLISSSLNNFSYHSNDKPVNLVRDFDALNENMTRDVIGR
jgi:hypothetical protein